MSMLVAFKKKKKNQVRNVTFSKQDKGKESVSDKGRGQGHDEEGV